MAAVVVAASLGLWLALEHGLGARAESLTGARLSEPATTVGGPSPKGHADPTGLAGQPTVTSSATVTPAPGIPLAPRIVTDHLTFGATRKAETAAYAQRHYGTRTWNWTRP